MRDLTTLTRAIQRHVGAKPDGIYGPNTARAIAEHLGVSHGSENLEPQGVFDQRTEKNLTTMDPEAVKRFKPFLRRAFAIANSMGVTAKVIGGYRNRADQEAAKRRGALRAGYGYSWHNYGIALDLGLFKGTSYVDANDPNLAWTIYSAIGEIAPDYGIEWGGSRTSFVDAPHFHIDVGRSTPNATDRRKLKRGEWSL